MLKAFLESGRIVSTHGLRGEVRVKPWCDSADFLLEFDTFYLQEGKSPLKVEGARVHKNMLILKPSGVDDVDAAAALRGKVIYIDRRDAPLAEGEHFIQDLLGMAVIDADTGHGYGLLSDVFATGANDVYEITGEDGGKRLVPAIPDVVVEKDLSQGVVRIRPLKGLFEDED